MKPSELLNDKSKWTKGAYARRKDGYVIGCDDVKATCWCVLGAIHHCYRENSSIRPWDVVTKIKQVLKEKYPSMDNRTLAIPEWQDRPETTYEDVIEVLKEAGE